MSGAVTGPVLEIDDLRVAFETPRGLVHAVNGVSFALERGEALGILGESGSGKSVTVSALMGLLSSPPARIAGKASFGDINLLDSTSPATRRIRGDRISMIFQDAITSLNPGLTIGYQIAELFKVHRPSMSRDEIRRRAIELIDMVGIPSAGQRLDSYPFEFSGGMNQRIMIAMAVALEPDILIADEPTTALDVTVQAQIMQLLSELRKRTGLSLVLITHDIGIAAESTERVIVMYGGQLVEMAPTVEVIARPAHPYSAGLMKSMPHQNMKGRKLTTIEGTPPILTQKPQGCAFAPRCAFAQPVCRTALPPLASVTAGRKSACHFAKEVFDGHARAD